MQSLEKQRLLNTSNLPEGSIKVAVGIWNMKGTIPPTNSVKIFIDNLRLGSDGHSPPDIMCIATQECQRSICMSFFCEDK